MSGPPDWYAFLKTSAQLGCSPWDIDDDPLITPFMWHNRALAMMKCEAEAQAYHQKQARRSRGRGQ